MGLRDLRWPTVRGLSLHLSPTLTLPFQLETKRQHLTAEPGNETMAKAPLRLRWPVQGQSAEPQTSGHSMSPDLGVARLCFTVITPRGPDADLARIQHKITTFQASNDQALIGQISWHIMANFGTFLPAECTSAPAL